MVKHHDLKQLREEKVCFTSQLHNSLSLSEVRPEIQGRSVELGAELGTLEECSLLAFPFWLAHSAFLYYLRTPAQK